MRTRAKLEEEIAALASEVRELARTRGAGLPDVQTLVEFIVAAFGAEHRHGVAEAADSTGPGGTGGGGRGVAACASRGGAAGLCRHRLPGDGQRGLPSLPA